MIKMKPTELIENTKDNEEIIEGNYEEEVEDETEEDLSQYHDLTSKPNQEYAELELTEEKKKIIYSAMFERLSIFETAIPGFRDKWFFNRFGETYIKPLNKKERIFVRNFIKKHIYHNKSCHYDINLEWKTYNAVLISLYAAYYYHMDYIGFGKLSEYITIAKGYTEKQKKNNHFHIYSMRKHCEILSPLVVNVKSWRIPMVENGRGIYRVAKYVSLNDAGLILCRALFEGEQIK